MRTGQALKWGKTHTHTVVTGPVSPTQIKPIVPDYETRSLEKAYRTKWALICVNGKTFLLASHFTCQR